jgi:hypothetical protein
MVPSWRCRTGPRSRVGFYGLGVACACMQRHGARMHTRTHACGRMVTAGVGWGWAGEGRGQVGGQVWGGGPGRIQYPKPSTHLLVVVEGLLQRAPPAAGWFMRLGGEEQACSHGAGAGGKRVGHSGECLMHTA